MTTTRTVAVGAVAGALALWAVWGLWPSDARRIARALDALAADVSVTGPETPLERFARAARIGAAFTVDASIDPGGSHPALEGRDAIVGLAAQLRGTEAIGRLRFDDVTVTVDPSGATAVATMTATVTTRNRQSGDEMIDAREVEMQWVKQEGDWRISRATAVRTLQ